MSFAGTHIVTDLRQDFVELVRLITMVNRCYHGMEDRAVMKEVSDALKAKKTGLQLELLRRFPQWVALQRHDSEKGQNFSLRLLQPVRLPSGEVRTDAMHLPLAIAEKYLSETFLQSAQMRASQ